MKDTSTPVARIQFNIFTILWSIATLFHMAYAGVFDMKLNYSLLTLAALFVIYRPGSVPGFIILILLQLYDIFFLMPGVNNHWLFTCFVNITILTVLVHLFLKYRSFTIDAGSWYQQFAPIVRIEVLILYFYAVFHKLNSDFFNPSVSCATELLKYQNLPFVPLTSEIFVASGYFTVIIETVIPLLLVFKRTRKPGLLIGVVFHSILAYSSYNGYFDFSSMMFALYFLFTGPDFAVYLKNKWQALRNVKFFNRFSVTRLLITLVVILAVMGLIHKLNYALPDFPDFNLYCYWLIYNLVFLYFIIKYCLQKSPSEPGIFSLYHRLHWIFPVIVFLNGLSPYLGLKTENSFSMFSNLRTEGGVTNHYLIPASFQIFDYQREYVEILASSDPFLQSAADEKKLMVLFHFNDYIHSKKPRYVEYIYQGKKEIFDVNGGSGRRVEKVPYVLKKIFSFRLFVNGPQPCGH